MDNFRKQIEEKIDQANQIEEAIEFESRTEGYTEKWSNMIDIQSKLFEEIGMMMCIHKRTS